MTKSASVHGIKSPSFIVSPKMSSLAGKTLSPLKERAEPSKKDKSSFNSSSDSDLDEDKLDKPFQNKAD